MSRLRALTIPLVQGQNDAIAREILPDGALARLVNGRFNRAGEVALREGWRTVDMDSASGSDPVVRDLYSYGGSLVALSQDAGGSGVRLAACFDPTAAAPWYVSLNRLSPATGVRPVGGMPELAVAARRVSQAITPDGSTGVLFQQSETQSLAQYRVFRYDTDETVAYATASNQDRPRKVVAGTNSNFVSIDSSGAALRYQSLNVDAGTLSTVATLVTDVVTAFDVATARETAPAAIHLAWIVGGNVFYGQFALSGGAQVGVTKTVYSGGDAVRVALASDDVTVHVMYQYAVVALSFVGPVDLLSFSATSPFAGDVGPTALFGGDDVVEAKFDVAAVPGDGAGFCAVVGQEGIFATDDNIFFSRLNAAHVETLPYGAPPRSGSTLCSGLVVVGDQVAYGYTRDSAVVYADQAQVWFVLHGEGDDGGTGGTQSPLYAPGQAPGGLVLVAGRSAEAQPVPRAFVVDPTLRRQGVSFNGDLYVAGGALARWVGVETADSGILAPVLISATPQTGSGFMTPLGVYKYRALLRWRDSRGATYEGEVSVEEEVTMGATDTRVALRYVVPPSLMRSTDILGPAMLEVYRTEAGPGELFYLTETIEVGFTTDIVTTTDLSSDATLLDERRLYTEGEFGATSGRLDNVIPRGADYVAATRDRLVGAAPALEYQVSQVTLASEPVGWTDPGVSGPVALVYFDQANEAITGVATLDDSIVIGTARQLYTTGGEGPNFAGVGEFPSPARLPANVGFYDWRSLVETAEGLWFLGDVDKLHLLARGQAVPAWAGEAVQDSFSTGETVGAALQVTDHVAAWAVAGASAAASRLVVRDLPLQAWSTDTLPFVPVTLVSHDAEFWSADPDGTAWRQETGVYGDGPSTPTAPALVVETGDVQVFGLAGQGRLAVIEWEGVFQAAASLLVEISYDQGVSWVSLGTATVTGLTSGTPFREQWYPARQRGGKFRVRCTMTPTSATTEGCRLTAVTIFHTVRGGPSRLPSGNRR
jgi:hypothetical protein